MSKSVFVGLLVLGACLLASAQLYGRGAAATAAQSTRIRLAHGDYDCSCSFYCPVFGIKAGACNHEDYWGWGARPSYCCVPSYYDYDTPDRYDAWSRK